MTSPLILHRTVAVGFDQPFEMLQECHGRVERMLSLLERLAAHLDEKGHGEEAAQAARDVMRYFDLAGPAHHQDEEIHLFPLLRERGEPSLGEVVQRLQRDHLAMGEAWPLLRQDLQAVVEGALALPLVWSVRARWAAYAQLYREHIVVEESLAYPAARALAPAEAQAAMGREMAQRRGAR